jgi:hypothetical protein
MHWDLAQYSSIMKISITKDNPSMTITTTSTITTEFAGNFGFDINWGEKVKKGLKFGASAKETDVYSIQTVVKVDDRKLGDVLVNFGDKVVVESYQRPGGLFGNGPLRDSWRLREYNGSMFVITVEPKRVQ